MSARGEHNIGQLCRKEFGQNCYAIGFGTDHGTVAAASEWGGPLEIKDVRPSLKESIERVCHESETPHFMLGLRDNGAAHTKGLRRPRFVALPLHRIYFDKALAFHSPDPTDPLVTERVISIMLVEEY